MSKELKTYDLPVDHGDFTSTVELFFLKSEADKVIAHQKYKRCLAMAKWCESEENRLEAISPIFDTDKEYWEYNSDYWGKWHNRWLEIAEKFKEAK